MNVEDKFIGMRLEEIKGIAKDNSRSIADANMRLMKIDDDVSEVKEEIRDMSEIITDMHDNFETMMALNIEQRKSNKEVAELLGQVMALQKEMRTDINKLLDMDEVSYKKVGAL